MTTSLLPVGAEVERRVRGSPFLIMLDVDGTLAPITPRPDEAEVPRATRRVVAALARREGVHIVLVSGRAAADARRMVAVSHLWVIGNHGCEIIDPEGESTVDARVAPYRPAMAQVARRLRTKASHLAGVIIEDKVWTLSIHFRLADPAVVPGLRAAVEEAIGEPGLRMTEGKMLFEVRPPVSIHKGTAILGLAQRLGGLSPGGSLLFAGDDRTDEDAFEALRARHPEALTVRVAEEPVETAAEFRVAGTEDMREFLEWLASVRVTSS